MKKPASEWNVYRTRFLIKAKQLTHSLKFVDSLGREHRGQKGDYLMEWADGLRRITPREVFEDIYVPMDPRAPNVSSLSGLRRIPAMETSREPRRQQSA